MSPCTRSVRTRVWPGSASMSYTTDSLAEAASIALKLDVAQGVMCVDEFQRIRDYGGRVFVLGVGGSAANASHFVNDLRKLAWIEAYAPTDNVAELTARTNDVGWSTIFADWLA